MTVPPTAKMEAMGAVMVDERGRAGVAHVLLAALTWIMVSVPGFAQEINTGAPSGTITIGAALSFKGRYELSGLHSYNGYELAVKRI